MPASDLPANAALAHECPSCGSQPGDRCTNYKGKGKAPCPERLALAGYGGKRARRASQAPARQEQPPAQGYLPGCEPEQA